MAVNDTETFGAMIEDLEHVSNLIIRYAIFESLYLHRALALQNQLAESIIRLYTTMLICLSNGNRYYNLNTARIQVDLTVKSVSRGVLYMLQTRKLKYTSAKSWRKRSKLMIQPTQ